MIKQDKVSVNINLKNLTHYRNLGYIVESFDIKNKIELLVNVIDIPKGSKTRITAICEVCESENEISIGKYYTNKERNDKGFYSCFNCKNIEKEKTCLQKYGVKSYSQTEEFKVSESIKWKGIQKGAEKGRKTMQEKYGVDSWFKTKESRDYNREWMNSDEFKEKSKLTMMNKFGTDHFSKTQEFRDIISSKKDLIMAKIKETFLKKYGVEWISNHEETINKGLQTRIKNGFMIADKDLESYQLYSREVRKLTKRVTKSLFENWDGYDYYDDEYIKGNFCFGSKHRLYPSIDHKISIYHGFNSNIPAIEISDISNLCITKRFINSTKRRI
jgi:hypothetical protein